LVGGRQWEYLPSIITYFKFNTTYFAQICHFEITKQKKISGEGAPPSHTHSSWLFVPLNLELALTPVAAWESQNLKVKFGAVAEHLCEVL